MPLRCLAGRAWHDSQSVLVGCVAAKLTPGADVWQIVHSPFQTCFASLGVWQVPQSVRVGCVKTNFAPVAWHTEHSWARAACLGLWHSEHFEAAMSWQREQGIVL